MWKSEMAKALLGHSTLFGAAGSLVFAAYLKQKRLSNAVLKRPEHQEFSDTACNSSTCLPVSHGMFWRLTPSQTPPHLPVKPAYHKSSQHQGPTDKGPTDGPSIGFGF
jgi:hypothetical protein